MPLLKCSCPCCPWGVHRACLCSCAGIPARIRVQGIPLFRQLGKQNTMGYILQVFYINQPAYEARSVPEKHLPAKETARGKLGMEGAGICAFTKWCWTGNEGMQRNMETET